MATDSAARQSQFISHVFFGYILAVSRFLECYEQQIISKQKGKST